MKTEIVLQVGVGTQGKEEQYMISQEDDMEVTAFQVDSNNRNQYLNIINLGKYEDINDAEVSGQIADRLSRS